MKVSQVGGGTPAAPIGDESELLLGVQAGVDVLLQLSDILALYARKASPALTGVPTAPTAALGTNTDQVATMAALQAEISAVLNSAPGALDTLNELAAALGDDANFATTVTNALALKAPLASPALTGNPTAPDQSPGDNSGKISNTKYVDAAVAAASLNPYQVGYLYNLTLSNNGSSPNTKIDIAAGKCRDDGDAFNLNMSAGTIDFATNGANGLASGDGSLANNSWYHCWAIAKADGTKAYFASSSLTPTLPTDYVYKRRLGSVRTDSSAQLMAFSQYGDEFLWNVSPLNDYNDVGSTTAINVALTVPSGVKVWAKLWGTSTVNPWRISSPDAFDAAVDVTSGQPGNGSNGGASGDLLVRTDTSRQVKLRSSGTAGNILVYTIGWIDHRGRLT